MYYFIINPNSRSGKGALIWRDLENILRERNIKYQTFFTEYKGHAVKHFCFHYCLDSGR